MVIIHGTQRFRDRVTAERAAERDASTTILGSWYATVLRWRPAVALFVNASALLPVFMPSLRPGPFLTGSRPPSKRFSRLTAFRLR
jgi:hypothetical protein